MANIRVRVQLGKYPSNQDREIVYPLSEDLMRDEYVPIDFPSVEADVFTREVFCTPTAKIQQVMQSRERMAKILSEALTHALLDTMKEGDTTMGYPKQECDSL